MKLRVHKTRRALWVVLSILVFVAVGFLVRGDVKGEHPSLFLLMAWGVASVFSGSEGLDAVPAVALWLGTWMLVSAVIGWFLQGVAVLFIDWRREKSNPVA
jgi:hypothetical protein